MQEPLNLDELKWWNTTRLVLFHPAQFFERLPADTPYCISFAYLVKTSLITSLTQAVVWAALLFVILTSFFSIFAFFIAMFGFIFSPLLAIVTGLPPDKVIENALEFSKYGSNQILLLSAQAGFFIFAIAFFSIVGFTVALAGFAHLFTKILGGTSSFQTTFRTYSYSAAVSVVTLIPVVNSFVGPYGVFLSYFGMRGTSGLSKLKSAVVVIGAGLVPILLGTTLVSLDNGSHSTVKQPGQPGNTATHTATD